MRYCYNNPLTFVDPSGEIVWLPIIAGAVIGGYFGGRAVNGGEWNPGDWDWQGGKTYAGIGVGALAGALGGGIGAGVTGLEGAVLGGMVAGGVNGGGMTAIAGGSWDQILGGMVQGAVVGGLVGGASYGAMIGVGALGNEVGSWNMFGSPNGNPEALSATWHRNIKLDVFANSSVDMNLLPTFAPNILTDNPQIIIGNIRATAVFPESVVQSGYNIDRAVDHLNSNAIKNPEYKGGKCSPYVPNAINAGFGDARIPNNKRGGVYGPILRDAGFTQIKDLKNYNPTKGDIAVIQGYPGGTSCESCGCPCGHIQMYNGDQWVSDFFQSKSRPIYPGPKYELNKPTYEIYQWRK